MSSLRVRAQNKLMNKLGTTKPSKNVQFDTAHANFERTQSGVSGLDAALRGFIVSLKSFHISAQVLYGAVEAIGGTPENSAEMKQTVAELKNAFVHVDVNALNDTVKRFENRVMRPAGGWMGRAVSLKHQISEFSEEKLVYDHYTRKVMGLREARDKRSAQGKSEKTKDVEKLVRNEQKLAAKTNSYAKSSEATVANLREFVNTREATLAPIVQRLLEFRVQYAMRIAEESKLLQKMVRHDAAHEGVLGSLEKFATLFTGVGPDESHKGGDESDKHYAPVTAPEPDLPVQALSFASFVGEDPSQPSSRTASSRTASNIGWGSDMPALPQIHSQNFTTAPLSSPSSPSSGNAFFDDFGSMPPPPPPPSIQSVVSAAFLTAPVQPLSPASAANFTPWDDVPPPPPPQAKLASMGAIAAVGVMAPQFNTMPASPTAPPANSWDAFSNLGGASDFQAMHQNAMH